MASKKAFLKAHGFEVSGRGRLSREMQAKLIELGYVDESAPAKRYVTPKQREKAIADTKPLKAKTPDEKPIKVDVEGLYQYVLKFIPGERYGQAVDSIMIERDGISVTREAKGGAYSSKFYPYK